MLDQLLAQLKIEPEGAAPQADIEPLVAMGEQVLGDGDPPRAVSIFRQVRDMAPDNPEVIGGLAARADRRRRQGRSQADSRQPARTTSRKSRKSPAPGPRSRSLRPRRWISLRSKSALAANPDDHEARFELAAAKMAAGDRDAAADALLEIIRRDREWNDGAARKRFLQLLEAQGLEDPWSGAQRRRLSALLFT